MNKGYQVWPIGTLPKEWQRPELVTLKERGYQFDDAREVVTIFENKLAEYAGSKYAVAVDSCTDAVFLCLKYLQYIGEIDSFDPGEDSGTVIKIPSNCYLSVPMAIIHAGHNIRFVDKEWSGIFRLNPTRIIEGAVRFTKDMFVGGKCLQCCSFQLKKRLPIGKGGMIFTDDEDAVRWLRMALFEGRHLENDQWHDEFEILGWNMYMTPEDAARGLLLFDELTKSGLHFDDTGTHESYPDLSTQPIFQERIG